MSDAPSGGKSNSKNELYGEQILNEMRYAPRFAEWTLDLVKPYIGDMLIEIGAGIGNNTRMLRRSCKSVILTDIEPRYISLLREEYAHDTSVFSELWDVVTPPPELPFSPDTAFCSNVLEHVLDQGQALQNIHSLLSKNSRLILIVPQGNYLYCSLDEALAHHRRYSRKSLKDLLLRNNFKIEVMFSLNKIGVIGWLWRGKLRKMKTLGDKNLKLYDRLMPFIRFLDPILPWTGLSLVAIAKKP